MAAPTAERVRPEDLLAMQDGHRFELIDGQLVEREMSIETSAIAYDLNGRLHAMIRSGRLGRGFQSDGGLEIFPWKGDGHDVRFADGGFVAAARMPGGGFGDGYLKVAPDLVFEVVSPNDIATEVETKVADYLRAGVKLVWVLYPETRTVRVDRADGTSERLFGDAVLLGDDVVPGFSVPIRELFVSHP